MLLKHRLCILGLLILLCAGGVVVYRVVSNERRVTYPEAIGAGRKLQPVRELELLFPSSVHFISYFDERFGTREWNSMAPLHGRYILEMTIPAFHVVRDHGDVRVAAHGAYRFELYDLETIFIRPGGSIQTGRKVIRRFGLAEWQQLVQAGGDWSAIEVQMRTDDPIDSFDEVWNRLR